MTSETASSASRNGISVGAGAGLSFLSLAASGLISACGQWTARELEAFVVGCAQTSYNEWMFRGPVLLAVLLALSPIGCRSPEPRAPEAVVQRASEKKQPEFFEQLALTPKQSERTTEIIEDLYAGFEEYDKSRLVLLDRVIAQIRAGKLDREELVPLAEVAVADFEAAQPVALQAMEDLHEVLNQEQRKKLVKLFSEGEDLTEEERQAAQQDELGRVLDLTAAQKTRIYPALAAVLIRHWGVVTRFRAAVKEAQRAFVQEELDVHELAIASDLELMALGEVILEALEIGMRELTPQQRQTLAAVIDASLRSPNPTKESSDSVSDRSRTSSVSAAPSTEPSTEPAAAPSTEPAAAPSTEPAAAPSTEPAAAPSSASVPAPNR